MKLRLVALAGACFAAALYVTRPGLFVTPTDPPPAHHHFDVADGLPNGVQVRQATDSVEAAPPAAPRAAAADARPPPAPAYKEQVPAPKDFRDAVCPAFVSKIRSDAPVLPNTSVIFCFCNEPMSSLYHSIHSVIDRTPRHLLHEIILVDDGSNAPHLQKPLEDHVATLPVPVHIVRQHARTGLMKARVAGARKASGVTLTFLDSHIDCSVDWAEPLM